MFLHYLWHNRAMISNAMDRLVAETPMDCILHSMGGEDVEAAGEVRKRNTVENRAFFYPPRKREGKERRG